MIRMYLYACVSVCVCVCVFVCYFSRLQEARQAGRAHRVVVLPSGEARDCFNHARRIPLLHG
jgi:hypothetical protein